MEGAGESTELRRHPPYEMVFLDVFCVGRHLVSGYLYQDETKLLPKS